MVHGLNEHQILNRCKTDVNPDDTEPWGEIPLIVEWFQPHDHIETFKSALLRDPTRIWWQVLFA